MRVLHLSTNGDDSNPGTCDAPLATPAAARDRLRALRRAGRLPADGAVVEFQAGCYRLAEPLALVAEDGGTAEAPVVYRAREGETVRLLGGRRLDPDSFTPVTDPAMRARLAPEARPHVRQCDLRSQGVTDFGAFASRGFSRKTAPAHLELFFNHLPMTVAQWPDAGQFACIYGYTRTMPNEWGSESGDLTGGFTYEGDRPKGWAPGDDVWVHGYWAYDWANSYERVRRLDPEARVVETAAPHGNYHFTKGQRFYFLNVFEELDQPGEFYVDRATGILYFWPPAALEGADILVSELAQPLIKLDGVSHVRFEGLILEAGRDAGIAVTEGEAVAVAGCTLRNLGTWAVTVKDGRGHTVAGCDITGTGDGGVRLSGGDRATLTPCDHAVLNCHIHHYARWSRCYVAAIGASGVGMRFAHNLIHDAPHNAILFTGNDFTIENNEIYRVCLETGDAGAIYTGRDFTYRGNVIRRNFIHHMGGVGMGSIGIYMDDCVSGTHIAENVLWHCQYGVMLGGGRDFVVDNNIFVECRPAIHADARGVDKNPVWQRNITTMKERLDAMKYHEPPYSVRYPEIAGVDPHYAKGGGVPPEHNRVSRNLCWRCDTWITDCWPAVDNGVTETDNLVGVDPGFADPDFGDFTLRGGAPVPGFRPIPLNEIGLVRDATRRQAPPRVRAALLTEAADRDGEPRRVRLIVRNDGAAPAGGTLRVADTEGGLAGESTFTYALAPGERREFRLDIPGEREPGVVRLHAVSDDSVVSPAVCRLDLPYAIHRVPPLPDAAEDLCPALAAAPALRIRRDGALVGEVRLAYDGDSLAVHLVAHDARFAPGKTWPFSERNPWQAPFLGLLTAPVNGGAIRQVVFFPDGGGQGTLWAFEGRKRIAPPACPWRARPCAPSGYELVARIPAAALGLDSAGPDIRLQGMLGAQPMAHAATVLPLFGSRFSPNDAARFCLCRLPEGISG